MGRNILEFPITFQEEEKKKKKKKHDLLRYMVLKTLVLCTGSTLQNKFWHFELEPEEINDKIKQD